MLGDTEVAPRIISTRTARNASLDGKGRRTRWLAPRGKRAIHSPTHSLVHSPAAPTEIHTRAFIYGQLLMVMMMERGLKLISVNRRKSSGGLSALWDGMG